MKLYHGSDKIIEHPIYNFGESTNDYGKGFYLTEDIEKANAWAVSNGKNTPVCNEYELFTNDLSILYLDDLGTLSWFAEVLSHRGTKDESIKYVADALVNMYKPNTDDYDVIIGYRADDSYTRIIDSFLANQINIDEVNAFFHEGNLGQQIFLKSEKAFSSIYFINAKIVLNPEEYLGYDLRARKYVEDVLDSRLKEIQLNSFSPTGITAQKAIHNKYIYNKSTDSYSIENEQNISININNEER